MRELDNTVSLPRIANVWVAPIRNRLDILATGIKVNGNNIDQIEEVAQQMERGYGRCRASRRRWRSV